ncbi:hypothetical protein [Paracoccus niistensis]|uniref:Uncharacterized protein n=1 Tax=Paracoccus niistensis TaxID=632935 RepID=A0ABV6I7Z3_9RHOB
MAATLVFPEAGPPAGNPSMIQTLAAGAVNPKPHPNLLTAP